MPTLEKQILNIEAIASIGGKDCITRESVLKLLAENEAQATEIHYMDEDTCVPNTVNTVKYFLSQKSLLLSLFWLLVLLSPDIALEFNRVLVFPPKVFEFCKIFSVIPIAIALSNTATFYFKDCQSDYEVGVPTAKTIAKYITQSWLLYIGLSTTTYLYTVNFEALGIDVIKDIVGTLNVASMIFGLAIFTLWRWFRTEYHFLFSTIENMEDSNSTWGQLTAVQKSSKSLAILFFVIWILTNIYIHLSAQ
jgi:hypothetical protein